GDLWGLHNTGQAGGTVDADIDAPEGWNIIHDAPTIVVASIDSGADYTHPDLSANIYRDSFGDPIGWDFVNGDGDPMDDNGHGTHTAGTIGAKGNNALGVCGVCWNVKIMPLKFIDAGGAGSASDAIQCI